MRSFVVLLLFAFVAISALLYEQTTLIGKATASTIPNTLTIHGNFGESRVMDELVRQLKLTCPKEVKKHVVSKFESFKSWSLLTGTWNETTFYPFRIKTYYCTEKQPTTEYRIYHPDGSLSYGGLRFSSFKSGKEPHNPYATGTPNTHPDVWPTDYGWIIGEQINARTIRFSPDGTAIYTDIKLSRLDRKSVWCGCDKEESGNE